MKFIHTNQNASYRNTLTSASATKWVCSLHVCLLGSILLALFLSTHVSEGKSLAAPSSALSILPSSAVAAQIPKSQNEVILSQHDETDGSVQHRHVRAAESTGIDSLTALEEENSKQLGKNSHDIREHDREVEFGGEGHNGNTEEEGSEENDDSTSSQQQREQAALSKYYAWKPSQHFPVVSSLRWLNPQLAGSLLARPGRADSNFIRFGRSSTSNKHLAHSLESEVGGDVADGNSGSGREGRSTGNLNFSNNKKNNFIRLGRENGKQNNFIRLGRRSGLNVTPDKRLSSPFINSNYAGRYPTSTIGFFPSSSSAVYNHHTKPLGAPSAISLPKNYYYYWGKGNGAMSSDSDVAIQDHDIGSSKLLEKSPLNDAYYYYYNH